MKVVEGIDDDGEEILELVFDNDDPEDVRNLQILTAAASAAGVPLSEFIESAIISMAQRVAGRRSPSEVEENIEQLLTEKTVVDGNNDEN